MDSRYETRVHLPYLKEMEKVHRRSRNIFLGVSAKQLLYIKKNLENIPGPATMSLSLATVQPCLAWEI